MMKSLDTVCPDMLLSFHQWSFVTIVTRLNGCSFSQIPRLRDLPNVGDSNIVAWNMALGEFSETQQIRRQFGSNSKF